MWALQHFPRGGKIYPALRPVSDRIDVGWTFLLSFPAGDVIMEMFESKRHKVIMLRVNPHEALKLIESLTQQMLSNSPNVGRHEQYLKDGRDFSIAVHKEGV